MKTRRLIAAILATAITSCDGGDDGGPVDIGPRVRTSAALRQFDSCDSLAAKLRANYKEELRTSILQQEKWYGDDWYGSPVEDGAEGAPTPSPDGSRQEGVDYSGTNNQEAGVDEADFVKTDGNYIYVLSGNHLEVLGVAPVGAVEKTGSLEIEGWPGEMLLAGDRVSVFSYLYTWDLPPDHRLVPSLDRTEVPGNDAWYRVPMLTKLTVVDVSDHGAPKVARELYLEGMYQTAREIEGTVRMVSHAWIDLPGVVTWIDVPPEYWSQDLTADEREARLHAAALAAIDTNDAVIDAAGVADFMPRLLVADPGGALTLHPFDNYDCTNVAIPDDGMSRGFTSILSLDLFSPSFGLDADHIVSSSSIAYASLDTLLIAEPAQDPWWFWGNEDYEEASNIHRFDIGTPGETAYTGSGRVDGLIRGQFSLSEHEGHVRVATTSGQGWWTGEQPTPENHVFVLAGASELAIVGHLGGIAVGETIWSSRFVGDRAYLVTFRRVDPLWTIDLSDPASPHVEGELQVPGVSTYIHPLAGDHLLTIGYGGDSDGLDWTPQVSLFDVTDFAAPELDASLGLVMPPASEGWSYGWSEATYEHKAFQYWAPLALLAVPLSTYRWTQLPCADGSSYCQSYEYRSGLELISVDPSGSLTRYGSIDHSPFFNSDPGVWWYYRDIRRSIFMPHETLGDLVYAVSDRGVTAHRLEPGLPLVGSVPLEGRAGTYYYW